MKRAAEHIKGVVIDTHPHPSLPWVTVVCTLRMPDPGIEFTRIHVVDLPDPAIPAGHVMEATIVCLGGEVLIKGLEGHECVALEWRIEDDAGQEISCSDGWRGCFACQNQDDDASGK